MATSAVAVELATAAGRPPRLESIVVDGRRTRVLDRGPQLVVDGVRLSPDALHLIGEPQVDPTTGGVRWREAAADPRIDLDWVVAPVDDVVRFEGSVLGAGRLDLLEYHWDMDAGPRVGAGTSDSPVPLAGLGQPVFGPGWFSAIEHPGAHNRATPHGVRLGIPLVAPLHGSTPFPLPGLVIGRARQARELDDFWDYIDTIRARPARLVVLANNWYQLGSVGRMDEASVVAELGGFDEVEARAGLRLDHYCLDDPWDGSWEPATGLWGRLDPDRFPNGVTALAQAAGGAQRLGLWVGPWGGYFDRKDRRVGWGAAHGYETHEGSWPRLCPAGDAYRAHLIRALSGWASAGIGYWKLDGVQFDCPETGHGHAVGEAGRTDQMDRFARLLQEVRAANPAAVLTFTTGSNPSPWWLRHADFLWRGGLDDDAPEQFDGPPSERFDTYIDSCLDALRHTAVPVSAIVTFSLVENQVRGYRDSGGAGEATSPAWSRHCWLLAGRGSLHHDLYVGPGSLSEAEWDVLAGALRWVGHHQVALARSRMFGGRPQAGEAYGFAGWAGGRFAGCIRNPSAAESEIDVSPGALGLATPATAVEMAWGRSAHARSIGLPAATVVLEPFEVAVFSGEARDTARGKLGPG